MGTHTGPTSHIRLRQVEDSTACLVIIYKYLCTQYVSSGWDNRLHIWKAYHPSRRHTLLKSSRHLKEVKLEADKERREKKENKEVL